MVLNIVTPLFPPSVHTGSCTEGLVLSLNAYSAHQRWAMGNADSLLAKRTSKRIMHAIHFLRLEEMLELCRVL